ncbi:biotin/lipoyl-containing protein [Aquimarina sp. 2201CG5-10]|uniref:biotin/lipoyl-containing protein n=1 Tax=Aquimarina callyspongiae TaxID=3098150 RepID=UPI002AB5B908|nr:biotin/lipoyl-containing protein [Aquimarina sp. 2201CG5-10]MDY8138491.1 biotin/lipoyl-containing protein [Aquimarina sp. 2201CG5-10]
MKELIKMPSAMEEPMRVGEICHLRNSKIKKGDIIIIIESENYYMEIEAPVNGLIQYNVEVNQLVRTGDLLCAIDREQAILGLTSNSSEV